MQPTLIRGYPQGNPSHGADGTVMQALLRREQLRLPRASRRIAHQGRTLSVSVRTTASRPRPCGDAERSLSSNEAGTFAAAGCCVTVLG